MSDEELVTWTSPLAKDDYVEFRDNAALEKLGILDRIKYPLKEFWPNRGAVWDATGYTPSGNPIILEAKAHIPEAASPGSAASPKSLELITSSLDKTKKYLSPRSSASWTGTFYQYANRLAFQYYLRVLNGLDSRLIFLDFLNAKEMDGPVSSLEWKGATRLIHAYLGLPADLESFRVYHVYVDAEQIYKH